MDRVCNGKAGVFLPVVQRNTLETSLRRVYEKTPVWRIMWQTKGRKQARYVCAVAQLVFHVERFLFRFLKLLILTSSWTRFHCLSREAKSSDCCFDKYKSRARSFRSSCVIQCGSLPLVPEYVDSISSKDIDSAESSLEGIFSSDEKRRSLFTRGMSTGISSEWCPWCSRYRRRKWTRRHEFKSWTRLIAFHIALILLGKVWIQ